MDGQDPGRSIAWAGLVIVGILMLAGSAYFSSVKSALVSANKTHLRSLSDGGNRRARIALDQAENCERVMFTVLPGLYLMQVGFVTVLAQLLFRALGDSMARRATAVAVGAVCGALLLFVVSDVLLASVAASHADGFAVALAPTLKAVTILLFPLSALLRGVQAAFRRMFHLREEPTVTEDELSTIIDTIEEEGVIDAEQGSLLQSALEFAETTVADVLTLRDDVVGIEVGMRHEQIMEILRENKYSRFPVYEKDMDHVIGILHVRAYLKNVLKKEGMPLRHLCTPVFYTTLDAEIDHLLERMSHAKATMAVVRDGEGRVCGIVTVEDFLEELVGEIFDEDDVVNDRFMKLGGDYFRVSAACTMGELFRDMSYRGKVNVSRVKTVGAWVVGELGHVPEVDETFTWRDLTVTVTEVEDGRLRFVEVKLANPLLDAVTAHAGAGEEADKQ